MMSQNEVKIIDQTQYQCEPKRKESGNNLVQQVINNQMFKLFLKDMVEDLFYKKCQQERSDRQQQPQVSAESFIQEISDNLMLIAQTEANKKIKEAEKFFKQLYQHKVKQLEDRFQLIVDKNLKEIQFKMQQIESKSKMQTSILSPVKTVLKQRQVAQVSINQHLTKRMQLKQKILNTQHAPQARHSMNIESTSLLSDSLNDVSLQKFSQKIKSIEENFKLQIQAINQKIIAVQTKAKSDLQISQADVKEHIDTGFQGIWNVISNLEKRMMV